MRTSRLLNIFLVVFVDLLGFGLILPLLPFFVADYGGSDLQVGLLVATYAAAQFIGAPVLGRLSDRFGRRPVLMASIAGSIAGLLLLAVAEPLGRAYASVSAAGAPAAQLDALRNAAVLTVMFVARGLSGLAAGNITVAQAYISDVTDDASRARGMGLIGAAFGLGFILGPAVGGVLSRWGYGVPAFAAAGLAALNLAGVWAFLPEPIDIETRRQVASRASVPLISISRMVSELSKPRVGPLMTIRLTYAMAVALFQTMFTLWSKERLGLGTQETAFLLAYVGVLTVIVQGGVIGRLTDRYSDTRLISSTLPLSAGALLAWAFTPSVGLLLLVLVPIAFGTGVLNTVINSAISRIVPAHEVGGALGTSGALESLSRVVSPTVGGWLMGAVGPWAPGVLGAALMGWVTLYAWRRLVFDGVLGDA